MLAGKGLCKRVGFQPCNTVCFEGFDKCNTKSISVAGNILFRGSQEAGPVSLAAKVQYSLIQCSW